MGAKLKLDFGATHEKFESTPRLSSPARQLLRLTPDIGTQVHIVRSGDSLWTLTHRFGDLPEWLMEQYNPDVAFDALKAGTQIVLPRVADLGNPMSTMRRGREMTQGPSGCDGGTSPPGLVSPIIA